MWSATWTEPWGEMSWIALSEGMVVGWDETGIFELGHRLCCHQHSQSNTTHVGSATSLGERQKGSYVLSLKACPILRECSVPSLQWPTGVCHLHLQQSHCTGSSAWNSFTWAEHPLPLPCEPGIKWNTALLRGFHRNSLSWTLLLLESSCPTWTGTREHQTKSEQRLLFPTAGEREKSEQRTCRNSCSWLRDSSQWQGFIFKSSEWIFVYWSSSDGWRRVESNWRFSNTIPFSLYPHSFIHVSVLLSPGLFPT